MFRIEIRILHWRCTLIIVAFRKMVLFPLSGENMKHNLLRQLVTANSVALEQHF